MDRLEADQKFFRGLILTDFPALAWGLLGFLGLFGVAFFLVTLMPEPEEKQESRLRRGWRGLLEEESKRLKAVGVLVLLWLLVPAVAGFSYLLVGKVLTGTHAHSAANYSGRLKFWQPGVLTKAPETNSCQQTPMSTKSVILIAVALGVSLCLSVVRFVDKRLKYTVFVYRAFILLQFPGPSAGSAAEK